MGSFSLCPDLIVFLIYDLPMAWYSRYMLFGMKIRGERKFYGVALFLILLGVGTFCTGIIQAVLETFFEDWHFGWPAAKIIGGVVVIGLGYIVMELELIRNKD